MPVPNNAAGTAGRLSVGAPAAAADDTTKDLTGKTVKGPDGQTYIVVRQEGDTVHVVSGAKRTSFKVSEVQVVAGDDGADAGAKPVEKNALDAERLERIRQTRDFLDEILSNKAGSNDNDEPVEKESPSEEETTMDNNQNEQTSLTDVINFCNQWADQIEARLAQYDELNKKLDTVGELAKSLDITDRLEAIQAELDSLKSNLGAVEEVSKRVEELEAQPGHRASVPVQGTETRVAVNKSANRPLFSGLF